MEHMGFNRRSYLLQAKGLIHVVAPQPPRGLRRDSMSTLEAVFRSPRGLREGSVWVPATVRARRRRGGTVGADGHPAAGQVRRCPRDQKRRRSCSSHTASCPLLHPRTILILIGFSIPSTRLIRNQKIRWAFACRVIE